MQSVESCVKLPRMMSGDVLDLFGGCVRNVGPYVNVLIPTVDVERMTLLHMCIVHDDMKMFDRLVGMYGDVLNVNVRTDHGMSCFALTYVYDRVEMRKVLLDNFNVKRCDMKRCKHEHVDECVKHVERLIKMTRDVIKC